MSSILPVPHRRQIADGYCLPACVQMVFAYLGIELSQEKIARKLKTVPRAGTPGFHLQRLASSALEVIYRSGDVNDLRLALNQGLPPIVLVATGQLPYWGEATAHAVVVIGIEGSSIIVNDPAMSEPAIQVSVGDFELAWDELVNRYGLRRKR
jgi:ABC-type bacteriocin/lantibiotic exporter with double-glycine peptidase domain